MRTLARVLLLAGAVALAVASDSGSGTPPGASEDPAVARVEVKFAEDGTVRTGLLEDLEDEPAEATYEVQPGPDGSPPRLPPVAAEGDPMSNATLYASIGHPDNVYLMGYTQQCPFLFRRQLLDRAAYLHSLAESGGSKRQESDIIHSMRMEALGEAEFVCKRLGQVCAPIVGAKLAQSKAGTGVPLDQEQSQPGYNFTCTDSCLHMARLFPTDLPEVDKKTQWPEGRRPDAPVGAVVLDDTVTSLSECTQHLAGYLYNRTVPGATAVLDPSGRAAVLDQAFLAGRNAAEVKFSAGLTSNDVANQLCKLEVPGAEGGSSLAARMGKQPCLEAMRRETHAKRKTALGGVGGVTGDFAAGWGPATRQWTYLARKLERWMESMSATGGETHIGMFPHKVDFILRLMHGVVDGAVVLPGTEPEAPIPHRARFHVCQTGLGSGHSALAFLASHPDVVVTSFDVGILESVRPISGLLAEWFDRRHMTVPGHTRTSLPQFAAFVANSTGVPDPAPHATPCDLVFLDASDSRTSLAHDLKWFASVSSPGALVLLNEHSGEDAESLGFMGSLPRGYLRNLEDNTMTASGADAFTSKFFTAPTDRDVGVDGRQKAWRDAVAAGIIKPRAYITGRSEEDDEADRGCVRTLRASLRPLFGVGGEAFVRVAADAACAPWMALPSSANITAPSPHHPDNYAWLRQDATAEMLFAVAPSLRPLTGLPTPASGPGPAVVDAPGEEELLTRALRRWGVSAPRMFRSVVDPADALPHDIAVGTFSATVPGKGLARAGGYFFAAEAPEVDWRAAATPVGGSASAKVPPTPPKRKRKRKKRKGKKAAKASAQ